MVKASKLFKIFLTGKKEKNKDEIQKILSPQPPPPPPTTPIEKIKSFNHEYNQKDQLTFFFMPKKSKFAQIEEISAIKIQSLYRSHLARKALRALKGLVKLQALVRGFLVRKKSAATMRSMQALLSAQARYCAQRAQIVESQLQFQETLTHQSKNNSRTRKINHVNINQTKDLTNIFNKTDLSSRTQSARFEDNSSKKSSLISSTSSHNPRRKSFSEELVKKYDPHIVSHELSKIEFWKAKRTLFERKIFGKKGDFFDRGGRRSNAEYCRSMGT